ncbi:MAG: hypothetical protein EAX81_02370 [Candidatus Thorarchaeota archaeon]|nr:hypothetical protein [Candidatus Thorarchaeota archaeon]
MAYYGYGRGRGGGFGRGRGSGMWPGNGPFRDLPPWERPGWLYGPGSCWYLGYRNWPPLNAPTSTPPSIAPDAERRVLEQQKAMLQQSLESIQESLKTIQERLAKLEEDQ